MRSSRGVGATTSDSDGIELAGLLERHFRQTNHRAILVLDQFEERLKESDLLERLYAEVARLANTRSEAATVVISIREDYLAGLEQLMRRVSGLLDASFRVPSLSRAALTEAVYGPLKALSTDVTVDKGLVDEVLTDLEKDKRLNEINGWTHRGGLFSDRLVASVGRGRVPPQVDPQHIPPRAAPPASSSRSWPRLSPSCCHSRQRYCAP